MKIVPRIRILAVAMVLALIPSTFAIVALTRTAEIFLGNMTAERALMAQASGAERAVIVAETAQRAYLISPQRAYREEFAKARANAVQRLAELEEGGRASEHDKPQVDAILRSARAELALLDRMQSEGRSAAIDVVRSQQGRFEAQEMRQAVDGLRESQAQQINASSDEMRLFLSIGQWLAIGGALAGTLVVTLSLSILTRYLRSSFNAFLHAIERSDSAGVPQPVITTLSGEFRTLSEAYNMMRKRIEHEIRRRDEAEQRVVHLLSESGEALADRRRAADILGRISNRLPACLDKQELIALSTRFIPQLFDISGGALYFLNNSATVLSRVAAWGGCETSVAEFAPSKCWGLRRGQQHYVLDTVADVTCGHLSGAAPDGYVCMPLIAQGETVGLLYLEMPAEDAGRGGRDLEDMRVLCENLALALVNLNLRESLRHQSLRDPLTGLHNRRYLEETIELEFAKSRRQATPISVIICDIDHFKHVNDTHGHDVGDIVLRRFASALTNNIRKGDVACRFGGEEFVILLPGMTHEQAVERAEIVREQVRVLKARAGETEVGQVTASFGVATYAGGEESWSEVLRDADSALYKAKAAGRDRVCSNVRAPGNPKVIAAHIPAESPPSDSR